MGGGGVKLEIYRRNLYECLKNRLVNVRTHVHRGSRSDKRLKQQPVHYVGCQCIRRATGCPENEVSLSDFSHSDALK
jgi:hypothetical protein